MASQEIHHVTQVKDRERLSDYAVGIFNVVQSRKGIKKAITKGWVLHNDRKAQSGTFVAIGDEIKLAVPDANRPVFELPLDVIYEEDTFAVVYKPAGVLTNGNSFKTLENALPFNLRKNTSPNSIRPEPTHRLDFPTSGLVICAKTRDTLTYFRDAFERKAVHKIYHAVTVGAMPASGTITTMVDNKAATTHFEVITTQDPGKQEVLNLVRLIPETGRKHQLRVHLESIGFPIVGDSQYGEGTTDLDQGLFLTATDLKFNHPESGAVLMLSRKLPKKFRRLFADL